LGAFRSFGVVANNLSFFLPPPVSKKEKENLKKKEKEQSQQKIPFIIPTTEAFIK
jgi:hypothetical protein